MSEHRRETDAWPYKVLRFWPVIVFIGGTIFAYVKLGETVERHEKEVQKIAPMEIQVAVIRSQMDEIQDGIKSINRKLDRRNGDR